MPTTNSTTKELVGTIMSELQQWAADDPEYLHAHMEDVAEVITETLADALVDTHTQMTCAWCRHDIDANHNATRKLTDAEYATRENHGICLTCKETLMKTEVRTMPGLGDRVLLEAEPEFGVPAELGTVTSVYPERSTFTVMADKPVEAWGDDLKREVDVQSAWKHLTPEEGM